MKCRIIRLVLEYTKAVPNPDSGTCQIRLPGRGNIQAEVLSQLG